MSASREDSFQTDSQILVSHYVAEREAEIEKLLGTGKKKSIENKCKRPIGRIHYRTRSHKSFKMPRKMINRKRKSVQADDSSRCRKHRRRVHNIHIFLPKNNISSAGVPKKLPNHVWNAKRMVLEDYYGYLLPMRSSFRGFKALEKIIQSKTLIHDYSYYKPIKISTDLKELHNFISSYSVNCTSF
jgi:hypothetical protein